MLHFDVNFFLSFIAVFIVKIDENCYDFLVLALFGSRGVKNVLSAVHCIVTTF